MRLAAQLCTAAAAIMSMMMLAEGRVEKWEVDYTPEDASPLVPGVNLITARNQPLPLQLNRRVRARRSIYPGHQPQEEPNTNGNYWARRPGERYHPSGASSERSLDTQGVATERHESREPHPKRVYATHSTDGRDESRDSLSTARAGERFRSHVHQDPPAATSHGAGVHALPRGNMPQMSERDQHADNNRESLPHNNTRVTSSISKPLEGQQHSSYEVPPGPRSRADLRTVARATRNPRHVPGDHHRVQNTFSDATDEDEYQLEPLELPDPALCCGSNVHLNPYNAQATGAFQRVAVAGSVKVVEVPTQNNYPPVDVRDLTAEPRDLSTLSLTWTTPGEDLDHGTASGYTIRLSEKQNDLRDSHFDAAPEETLLEAAESLAAAGVYQPAGTEVAADVPLRQRLQPGRAYYVALKAFDNGGLFSGVSNMARVYVPESLTEENTATQHHATPEHAIQDLRPEEPRGASNYPETTRERGETTTLRESTPFSHSARGTDAARVTTANNDGNSEDQSLPAASPPLDPEAVQPDGAGNQKRRKGRINSKGKKKNSKGKKKNSRGKRKNSKGKKNNSRKRNKSKRRKQRTRDGVRRSKDSNTSPEEPEACEPSEQEQLESVSLCEARYSLALAIAYFSQNNDTRYLDYLSAALHRLQQEEQPSWRTS